MHLYFFSRESLLSRFKSFSVPFHEKEQRFKSFSVPFHEKEQRFKSFLAHLFHEKGVRFSRAFFKRRKNSFVYIERFHHVAFQEHVVRRAYLKPVGKSERDGLRRRKGIGAEAIPFGDKIIVRVDSAVSVAVSA